MTDTRRSLEWSAAEVALLRRHVQDGKRVDEIVELFARDGISRTYKAIERKLQKLRAVEPGTWREQVKPNPPGARRWNKPVRAEADRWLLLFDLHCPFHDAHWLNRLIDLALRERVTAVGIGGDLVDWTAFGKYGRQLEVEAEDEIRSTEQVLSALAGSFPTVVYAAGNHEMRICRSLGQAVGVERAAHLFVTRENVQITEYHWFEAVSAGVTYQCEHPRNASVMPCSVPRALAAKFGRHIVAGHGHAWGQAHDVSGRYWAIDAGVCADPERLSYVQLEHNTRPVVNQGACLLLDGTPVLLSPANIAAYERV